MANSKASAPTRTSGSSASSLQAAQPCRLFHPDAQPSAAPPASGIAVHASAAPPSSGIAAQPSAAPPASEIASRLLARHAQLNRFNHFELLEVPESADEATIRRAFNQAVRKYHPDLLSRDDQHLRPLAQEIVCRVGTALRVLENPATRQQYLVSLRSYPHPSARRSSLPSPRASQPGFRTSSLPSPGASQPGLRASTPGDLPKTPASALIGAAAGTATPEQRFEAARIQLKRGAIEEALTLASQACLAVPEHPKYLALHAWLRVERGDLKPGPIADEILGTLTWAMREQRTDLDIRLYRARVLQRLGRREEAIRDFSVVASMDERNLEAVREVRLHRAREERAAASSGVFSKLFKRP
jgi:tetratricopeptide (TPR) repeat protein